MSSESFVTHENTEIKYKYTSMRNNKHYEKANHLSVLCRVNKINTLFLKTNTLLK